VTHTILAQIHHLMEGGPPAVLTLLVGLVLITLTGRREEERRR
jgi:hypothetical protein